MKRGRFVPVLLALSLLCGCVSRVSLVGEDSGQFSSTPEPEPQRVVLLATGDNLIHDTIYQAAGRRAGGEGYDFSYCYEEVKDIIAGADIAILNQETLLAGDVAPLSNYPRFNSPTDLGRDLLAVGFDVITHANNHSYDLGEKGIAATLDFWDGVRTQGVATPFLTSGIYRDEAEKNAIPLYTKNGVTFAFLSFTERTNGLSLPAGSPMGVHTFDDEAWVEAQVKKAREQADVVVVSAHWGNEDTTQVSTFQQMMGQKLCDWGADLILGHHPHVLQPAEILTRPDGGECYVIYSLGNFISAQIGPANMASGMLQVEFVKTGEQVERTQVTFIPTITHYDWGRGNLRVVPFSGYTVEQAGKHGVRQYAPNFSHAYLQAHYEKVYPQFFGAEQ